MRLHRIVVHRKEEARAARRRRAAGEHVHVARGADQPHAVALRLEGVAEGERERAVEFELRPAAGAQRARFGQEMPDVHRHQRGLVCRCRRDDERNEPQQDAHEPANCGGMPLPQQRESEAARL